MTCKSMMPEYWAWKNMRARCYNRNHPKFVDYGKRGISVCRRWRESFESFFADMGPRPKGRKGRTSKYTLERLDNDGNYTPRNCVWATRSQQQRNTRLGRWVVIDGRRNHIRGHARSRGVPESTFRVSLFGRDAKANAEACRRYRERKKEQGYAPHAE